MGLAGLWRGNLSNVLRVIPTYGARCRCFFFFFFGRIMMMNGFPGRCCGKIYGWSETPKNRGSGKSTPQIIHGIGFSMIFTIHVGVALFLETPIHIYPLGLPPCKLRMGCNCGKFEGLGLGYEKSHVILVLTGILGGGDRPHISPDNLKSFALHLDLFFVYLFEAVA